MDLTADEVRMVDAERARAAVRAARSVTQGEWNWIEVMRAHRVSLAKDVLVELREELCSEEASFSSTHSEITRAIARKIQSLR